MKTYKNEIEIRASLREVWRTLSDPDTVQQYMGGLRPESSWMEGEKILFSGNGLSFQGHVTQNKRPEILEFSLLPADKEQEDHEENYIRFRYEMEPFSEGTLLKITRDANQANDDHSESPLLNHKLWKDTLQKIKQIAEENNTSENFEEGSRENN